jgi:hypothetical protein
VLLLLWKLQLDLLQDLLLLLLQLLLTHQLSGHQLHSKQVTHSSRVRSMMQQLWQVTLMATREATHCCSRLRYFPLQPATPAAVGPIFGT